MTQPPYGQPDPYQSNPYGQSPYGQQPADPYALPAGQQPMSGPPSSSPPGSSPPYSPTYQLPVSGAPTSGGYDPYGQQAAYAQQAAYGQQPGYGVPAGAAGYDPATGLPYSDKSKLAAGLLQLLPGLFLVLGGIGRLYAGNTAMGVTQLVLSVVVGWTSFWCGFLFWIPFLVVFGLWVWFVVDGIILLTGRPVDGQGRPLRPN
ncbi:hypothetical protein [Dactylosporangium aurantiacum]|uniref:hypothetical protein n=1 Tax=Dactylosporangium aurantiacum TaxID=35754 RepID=UPI000693AE90|nr:hypothetical protein [Dactylosporangium aurantiacum]MDG6104335.1 hypothetical protein [Dactylosporangium aurantiacum]